MADRPIIFSGPMVRALIEGQKTQTRRVLKPPYGTLEYMGGGQWRPICTKFFRGDRLYVREAFAMNPAVRRPDRTKNVIYRADAPAKEPPAGNCLTMDVLQWSQAKELKWTPSIHMPRWASRLTLTVTDVRVQLLQDISEGDARAEGVSMSWATGQMRAGTWRQGFEIIWNSLHGPDAWDANPWVVALTFTVEQRNIDAGGA